jgi:hypothetical protein
MSIDDGDSFPPDPDYAFACAAHHRVTDMHATGPVIVMVKRAGAVSCLMETENNAHIIGIEHLGRDWGPEGGVRWRAADTLATRKNNRVDRLTARTSWHGVSGPPAHGPAAAKVARTRRAMTSRCRQATFKLLI